MILPVFFLFAGCHKKSNYEKALVYYRTMKSTKALLLLKNSEVPKEAFLEGKIYIRLNDPRRAIKAFDRLLSIDSLWKDRVVDELKKEVDKAIIKDRDFTANLMLNKILEIKPDFELKSGNFFLGDWNFDSRNYERAVDFYTAGLEYDSTNMNARFKLSQCYIHLDDLMKAYQTVKKGIEIHQHWRFRYWMGKISYMLAEKRLDVGNYSSAELYLGKVISLGLPEVLVDDAYFLLGDIRFAQERYNEAKSCYKKVLRINRFAKPQIVVEARERLKMIQSMEVKS